METSIHDHDFQARPPALSAAPGKTEQEEIRLKEELLSVLLHDMRSPLGAITALTDLISTASERGETPDSRQLMLLQDAVNRAQRLLDDAFEIQAILRGSFTINATIIDLEAIIRCSADKARHAPYFYNTELHLDFNHDKTTSRVRIDVEKMETVLLGIIEQILAQTESTPAIKISTHDAGHHIAIRIENHATPQTTYLRYAAKPGMRGRLGTRRLGESRYSLQICQRVLEQMGAYLEINNAPHKTATIYLPRLSE